jgi:hypothetical protein
MSTMSKDPIRLVTPDIARRMQALAEGLGGAGALREVKHLEPSAVNALREAYPGRKVERNRKIPIPSWSPVGNVDVIVHPAAADDSMIALELKWCYIDKLYEAIWDLFKMALLATTGARTYLVTGATPEMWASSVGKQLFSDGIHAPAELCEVRLRWGQSLRAWDDLLWGGYDKCPTRVPSEIHTTRVARETVSGSDADWELRAVRVEAHGETMTSFGGGWPFPRPSDAVRPLKSV